MPLRSREGVLLRREEARYVGDAFDRLLPYRSWREGQREIAESIYDAAIEGKILLLCYPTGAGKTIAAIMGTYLAARDSEKKVFFLARTKDQAAAPLREIAMLSRKGLEVRAVVLRNKRDMCAQPIAARMSYEEFVRYCETAVKHGLCEFYERSKRVEVEELEYDPHPEKFFRRFARMGLCPYEVARALVPVVDVVVGSYVYLFDEEIRWKFLQSAELGLEDLVLVVDEAHNLPDVLVELMSYSLPKYWVKTAIREARKYCGRERLLQSLVELYGYLSRLEKSSGDSYVLVDASELMSAMPSLSSLEEGVAEVESKMLREGNLAPSYLSRIRDLARALYSPKRNYVLFGVRTLEGFVLKYQCVDPSQEAGKVFSGVHSAILMSGTLQPKEYMVSMLGLEEERVIEHRAVRDFSRQVRFIVCRELSSRYAERDEENYAKMAKAVSLVYELASPGVVLAVFPSYDYMKRVRAYMPPKLARETFVEREDTRLYEVVEFASERERCLVMAAAWGKLIEGVELRRRGRSLIRTVVVAGLPVPEPNPLNEKRIELLTSRFLDRERAWRFTYVIPAVIRVLQAVGRAVRSKRDKALVVVLDRRLLENEARELVEMHGYEVREVEELSELISAAGG